MKQNTLIVIAFLILFTITAAELGGLPAQENDSPNLEQVIQRINSLDRWNRIIDAVIATSVAALVILFFRKTWDYKDKVDDLIKKFDVLNREVIDLKWQVNKAAKDIDNLGWVVTFVAIALVGLLALLGYQIGNHRH